MSDSLRPHGLYSPWNSLGQNPGVGSLSLLQGIFPTKGLNPGPLHCLEKEMATHPSILAWRIPWTEEAGGLQSMGSQESDTTEWLSHSLHPCIAGGFFTSWVTRETQHILKGSVNNNLCYYDFVEEFPEIWTLESWNQCHLSQLLWKYKRSFSDTCSLPHWPQLLSIHVHTA